MAARDIERITVQEEIDALQVRSPRIEALRQSFYDSEVHFASERCRLVTESWKETEGEPLPLRRAKLFARVCEGTPIAIFDNELIVGSQTRFLRGAEPQIDFHPKQGLEVLSGDNRTRSENALATISSEDIEAVGEATRYWQGRSPGEKILQAIRDVMGLTFEDISYEICRKAYGINMNGARHANWAKPLQIGLRGIIAEIDKELAGIEFTSPEDGRKSQMLQAMKICCEAEIGLAKRYAGLARQMAAKEKNKQRKQELKTIAGVCEHVPENPARNFWEALQSVRFLHLGIYLEVGDTNVILGRIDQYLYPFFKSGREQDLLSLKEATELLCCFWIKMAAMEQESGWLKKVAAGGAVHNKMALGGVDRKGKDASNDLTYLILHVAGQMKVTQPLYLRWHAGTPKGLMQKAIWTNIQCGSEPAFLNDEQIIPGLVADGASLADARDYYLSGCVQPFPFGAFSGIQHFVNGAKVLELVMNNGLDPRTKKQLGIQTGDPRQFHSIRDWVEAFMKQWEYIYGIILKGYNIGELAQLELYCNPFTSAISADCIKKKQDVMAGDRYPQFIGQIFNRVFADVPDSLVAIKKLMYDKKKITVDELLDACAGNFTDRKGEHIRDMLTAVPKFGNDSGEPEEMYRLISDRTAAIIRSRKAFMGYPLRDTRNGATLHLAHGKVTGALPNGRKAGMPLADGGVSPSAGCDMKGPTATLRSVAKAVNFNTIRSATFNQKMPKGLLKTPDQQDRFIDLIETFFDDYNGYEIQWNIQDRETYIAAKANPSAYKDLVVRVGGYSAYFIELDSLLQDEIIARTEQWV